MYSYTISKTADSRKFDMICKQLESKLSGLKKETLLTDVDGSQIQVYWKDGKKIKIFDDYEVDAVYIDSEVNIDKFVA